jgi:type 2 lantibiotic biosynthesis protein LanM
MLFSQVDLARIAGRASTIAERRAGLCVSEEESEQSRHTDCRLQTWRSVLDDKEGVRLAKRLSWDGIKEGSIAGTLGNTRWKNLRALPAWIKTLEEVMEVAADSSGRLDSAKHSPPHPQDSIPFEDLFLPFLIVARRRVKRQPGSSVETLSPEARARLERSLIERLSAISRKVLQREFSIFRAARRPAWVRLLVRGNGRIESELYKAFVQDLLDGGLPRFFLKYSVLARLLSTALDFWVEATGEFLQRLERDLPQLGQTFRLGGEPLRVRKIHTHLSDFHHRGRSVMALEFDGGERVVYKPKDVGSEERFNHLLAWLNDHGAPLSFRTLRVINRSDYGWVEFVEQSACGDEDAAKRYYLRAGMLLCVLYLLQAVDCHCENLVAAGEHPVLIDCETLMHHRAPLSTDTAFSEAHILALCEINDSVFRTGMLPRWELSPDGRSAIDVSSLGAVQEQQTSLQVPVWHHVNTDEMELRYQAGAIRLHANAPSLNGASLAPDDYVEQILYGFRRMYRCFRENRAELLAQGNPLRKLYREKIRILFRQTDVYHTLLESALEPEWLRDGADFDIQLDALSNALLLYRSKPIFWPILKAETESLQQLDIPHFTAYPEADRLYLDGAQVVERCFEEPSAMAIDRSFSNLTRRDLEKQTDFIRASFTQREPPGRAAESYTKGSAASAQERLEPEIALAEAKRIASMLQQRAIRSQDGSATWIGFGYLMGARRYQLQPMGFSLYDGSCGAALFLSALEYTSGGAGLRDLALGALRPLHRALVECESTQSRLLREMDIGGVSGLGSIIYTLTRVSQFLNEPELLEDARKVCRLITPELIYSRDHFDLLGGAAGAILGLLALFEAAADSSALERAVTCGNFLMERRVTSPSGFKAWPSFQGQLLTGFSHGAAGIAYALLRLYESTRGERFRQGAEEAIAYERSVFDADEMNWPDFRLSESRSFMTTWCHGAPGIGLGRFCSLKVLDTAETRAEIEAALETTLRFRSSDRDHLCCGNFGIAEVLFEGSLQLGRPELAAAARRLAGDALRASRHNGYFRIFNSLPNGLYNPAFFTGTTGIGYELLRLTFSDRLPCVLRLA